MDKQTTNRAQQTTESCGQKMIDEGIINKLVAKYSQSKNNKLPVEMSNKILQLCKSLGSKIATASNMNEIGIYMGALSLCMSAATCNNVQQAKNIMAHVHSIASVRP